MSSLGAGASKRQLPLTCHIVQSAVGSVGVNSVSLVVSQEWAIIRNFHAALWRNHYWHFNSTK